MLRAGADKVSLNTAAVADPTLVVGLRPVRQPGRRRRDRRASARTRSWEVVVPGGREPTGLDAVDWAGEARDRRRRAARDVDRSRRHAVRLRHRAAGGDHLAGLRPGDRLRWGGRPADFVDAVRDGGADAVLAASIFHRRIHSIADVKARWRPPACRSGGGGVIDPTSVRFGADGLAPAVVRDRPTARS